MKLLTRFKWLEEGLKEAFPGCSVEPHLYDYGHSLSYDFTLEGYRTGILARKISQTYGPIMGHDADGEPIRELLKTEIVDLAPGSLPDIIASIKRNQKC